MSADEQDAPVSGEGLSEAEKDRLRPVSVHSKLGWPDGMYWNVERILAAREAAWAERVAAVLAEHYTWQAVGQPGDGWACRCGVHLSQWWPDGGVRLRESALDVALRGHVAAVLRAALAIPTATGDGS